MKIIVGLGNPGLKYRNTRHNIGFRVVDLLRKKYKIKKVITHQYYRGWEIEIKNCPVVIVKPKTFMNESGYAVKKVFERFNGHPKDYLIVHDDLDIPTGSIKIIAGKGPGGHNGVASVINELGTRDFIRVRIGIGREALGDSYVDYVLSPFLPEEMPLIERAVERACAAIEEVIRGGIEKAMSLYNT